MGSLAEATCDCGHTVGLMLGGGMNTFKTFCGFPALCHHCREVRTVNLLESPLKCHKCHRADVIAYDDARLGGPRGDIVFSWNLTEPLGRTVTLTAGPHPCPKC